MLAISIGAGTGRKIRAGCRPFGPKSAARVAGAFAFYWGPGRVSWPFFTWLLVSYCGFFKIAERSDDCGGELNSAETELFTAACAPRCFAMAGHHCGGFFAARAGSDCCRLADRRRTSRE